MREFLVTLMIWLGLQHAAVAQTSLLLVTAGTWIDADGISQPSGTPVNRVTWDGVTVLVAPVGFAFRADLKEKIWRPAGLYRQTVVDFINRMTNPEKTLLYAARASAWQVDDLLTQLAAGGTVDPGDPRIVAAMTALVTRGVLTAQRANALIAPP